MEALFFHSRKTFWGSITLCFVLASLLSACSVGGSATTPKNAPGCTTLGAATGVRGVDAAVLATVPLPGQPYQARATINGQWIFVSLSSSKAASNGIAVLQQEGEQVCLKRVIPLTGTPLGLTLTPEEDLLLIANYSGVAVIDVKQAEQSIQGALLGYVQGKSAASTISVMLSPDEHYAFTTNEKDGTLGLLDFQRMRADDFNADVLLGQTALGSGLSSVAVSLDNRHLYATIGAQSEMALNQETCTTQGALLALDLQRMKQDPAHVIVEKVAAGCDPARVYLSSDDSTAWVTARGDNKVLAFNTLALPTSPKNALLGSVAVSSAPIGIGIAQTGSMLFVANSNCFAQSRQPQTLTVFDIHKVIQGLPAVLATVHVGAFPREVTIENDDQTVLLTNFASNTLTLINATKLPHPQSQVQSPQS
jgi:DNA-binding beta-propeller fold protein YncE